MIERGKVSAMTTTSEPIVATAATEFVTAPSVAKTTLPAAESSEQQKEQVAGPQNKQQQHRLSNSSQHRSRPVHECVEHLFPHIVETHRQIRSAITGIGEGSFQQKMMKVIKQYINGCRNEYDNAVSSTSKCRRLSRSIARTMDLIDGVCTTFSDSHEYLHRMSELVAIYISCELSYAKEFTEHKPMIANRISNAIYKHLKVPNEEATKSNILRMFVNMPKMYDEREVMTKIFEEFIPKSQMVNQQEFSDKIYIQYIIVFYQWQQLENDLASKMRIIEAADNFMRPAKTLNSNSTYAYHLPKYNTRRTATRYILEKLKFFQDLRNASIYDNCLKSSTCVVDFSDDDPVEKTVQCTHFAEIVAATEVIPIRQQSVKLEEQIVLATVDLTLDDEDIVTEETSSAMVNTLNQWLKDLQQRAAKLTPSSKAMSMINMTNRQTATTSAATPIIEVINLDSDSEGETEENVTRNCAETAAGNEPELFSLDFEEPVRVDCDSNYYDCELSGNSFDDNYNDDDMISGNERNGLVAADPTKVASRFQINMRTYAAPKEKQNVQSPVFTSICSPSRESTLHRPESVSTQERVMDAADATTELSHSSITQKSNVDVGANLATTFPMPRIVDSFSCRRDSIHLMSTPLIARRKGGSEIQNSTMTHEDEPMPEEQDDDEEDFDLFKSSTSVGQNQTDSFSDGKVIYTQEASNRPKQQEFNTPEESDADVDFSEYQDRKSQTEQPSTCLKKPIKKQVKFNEIPIGPTRILPPSTSGIKLPIKPAININKYNNPPAIFSTPPLQNYRNASPALSSSSSICSESLRQIAQKEHIEAISTLFGGYHIYMEQQKSSTNTTSNSSNIKNKSISKFTNTTKSMHISRKSPTYTDMQRSASKLHDYSPASHSTDTSNSPSGGARLHAKPSVVNITTKNTTDLKLQKKCVVVIERSDVIAKYEKEQVAFINQLLEMQREKQRQRALERQRKTEEKHRQLNEKLREEEQLKAEIAELKRQRKEKQNFRKRREKLKQQEASEHHNKQLQELLRRKYLLKRAEMLRQRKLELHTCLEKLRERSTTDDEHLPPPTRNSKIRRRAKTNDGRKKLQAKQTILPDANSNPSLSSVHEHITLLERTVEEPLTEATSEKNITQEDHLLEESGLDLLKPPNRPQTTIPMIANCTWSPTKPLKIRLKRANLEDVETERCKTKESQQTSANNTETTPIERLSEEAPKLVECALEATQRDFSESIGRVKKETDRRRRIGKEEVNREDSITDVVTKTSNKEKATDRSIKIRKTKTPKTPSGETTKAKHDTKQSMHIDVTSQITLPQEQETENSIPHTEWHKKTLHAKNQLKAQLLAFESITTSKKIAEKVSVNQEKVSPKSKRLKPTTMEKSTERSVGGEVEAFDKLLLAAESELLQTTTDQPATAKECNTNKEMLTAEENKNILITEDKIDEKLLADEKNDFQNSDVKYANQTQVAESVLTASESDAQNSERILTTSIESEVQKSDGENLLTAEGSQMPKIESEILLTAQKSEIQTCDKIATAEESFEQRIETTASILTTSLSHIANIVEENVQVEKHALTQRKKSHKSKKSRAHKINKLPLSTKAPQPESEQNLKNTFTTDLLDTQSATTTTNKSLCPISPSAADFTKLHTNDMNTAIEISTEIAAAATTLTLLANTAATTAPILTTQFNESVPTPEPPDARADKLAVESDIAIELPEISQVVVVVPAVAAAADATIRAEKEVAPEAAGTMALLNFEATPTPTVPAYLFNGESRDVPTPTFSQLAATAPTQDGSAVAPEITPPPLITSAITITSVLSTSDHEVSSTQETVYESPKRNVNAVTTQPPQSRQQTTDAVLADAAAMLVQNNQVDTTHHLPAESAMHHGMRRRARKLSTHDEVSISRSSQPVHKRRKTFCAEPSTERMDTPTVEVLLKASSGTSPSTTTMLIVEKKAPTRKRGRPSKNQANIVKKPILALTANKIKRCTATATPPLTRTNCESPGARTYSKTNVMQKVFVPLEIEKCLDDAEPEVSRHVEKNNTTAVTVQPNIAKVAAATTKTAMAKTKSVEPPKLVNKKQSSTQSSAVAKDIVYTTVKGAKVKLLQKKNVAAKVRKVTNKINKTADCGTVAGRKRK